MILFRGADREDIDDENISVTRTNSTSQSRCSSTYRSRSRSPPPPDDEGVLNLDTKSSKIVSAISVADDPSAFDEAKPKPPPSEHQSRLEEAYQSSVEQHQHGSKQKCKRFSPSDEGDSLPVPHEQNGFDKNPESFKHTKSRRNTHKDEPATETFGVREKLPLLPLNYMEHLDRLKSTLPLPSANFQLPLPLPLTNTDTVRLYPPFLYPYQPPSGSEHPLGLFPNHFMTYQHHPLLFPDSYRKELPKVVSPTSPSRTSPPKTAGQLFSSVAPIH